MARNDAASDRPDRRRPDGQWRRMEIEAEFEITIVDGEEGQRLARQQAAVFRDILIWLQNNQTAQQDNRDIGHEHRNNEKA